MSALPITVLIFPLFVAMPAHEIFSRLRKHGRSSRKTVSIIVVTVAFSIALIIFGFWLGEIMTSPELRSLGFRLARRGDGVAYWDSPTMDVNMVWFPFALASAGIWVGMASGYFKVPIDERK